MLSDRIHRLRRSLQRRGPDQNNESASASGIGITNVALEAVRIVRRVGSRHAAHVRNATNVGARHVSNAKNVSVRHVTNVKNVSVRHVANVKNVGVRQAINAKRAGTQHVSRLTTNTRKIRRQYTQRGREMVGILKEKSIQQLNKQPLCLKIMLKTYHKYGLKHLLLIGVFVLYVCFGAMVFAIIEQPYEQKVKEAWQTQMATQRNKFVDQIMKEVFNNSRFLAFVPQWSGNGISRHLKKSLLVYENMTGVKFTDMKMDWDFWSAVLYTGSIATTIGYGHIYPRTDAGKILTMIYATCGIPLVLLLLQDMGNLLTVTLKYPWFQFKRAFRRALRYCTKQSHKDILRIETKEKQELHIFDLPVPVGVALVLIWVFIGALTFTLWDTSWSAIESFYFFFISLSTIGLGDLVPSRPNLLIMMFGYIIVGLSLVSMVVNLLQTKMQTTYEMGRSRMQSIVSFSNQPATLGVFQTSASTLNDLFDNASTFSNSRSNCNTRYTQTSLSLPIMKQMVLMSDGVHWVGQWDGDHQKSPDDVVKLVEADIDGRVLSSIGDQMLSSTEMDAASVNSLPRSEVVAALDIVHAYTKPTTEL